ncbi:LytTR family DNA-binding domain-containing protein [Arenibacter sp. GZD96]|uniref:LytR/AlgR family response regulator transcription factor n=1 Tax=Aurantibrevibacter litoralis TaxID=3106030 RepID=UPI002AFE1B7F|nr:LytTR family DNA-binding domain-containing protein [Arenibacter sp. GZD-96]MEA1784827.1 LytTR family DNA-binding domain-containing protein [Arenibacter sp. GZD-96]
MTIRVIIVDDEPLAIKVIQNYVDQVHELQLVRTFPNAVEAASFLRQNEIDLIFLDINLPILGGFEFMESLTVKPMVVITTAHEEYAVKGFELEAIDYLVKPIPFPRFLKAINRIIQLKKLGIHEENHVIEDKPSIFVKVDKKKLQKIYLHEILVLESLKDYVRIKTVSAKYIVHKTLSSFTEELPEEQFVRIHRSYTIAIDKVQVVQGNCIEIDGVQYTIGRNYLNDAKQRILKNSAT